MQKGSNNRAKQRKIVAKLHEKVANQRKDFLHKCSRTMVDEYDCICIEDLDMKAMSQSLNFGKSVADNGWGMFTSYLKYKLEEKGKKLALVRAKRKRSKDINKTLYHVIEVMEREIYDLNMYGIHKLPSEDEILSPYNQKNQNNQIVIIKVNKY